MTEATPVAMEVWQKAKDACTTGWTATDDQAAAAVIATALADERAAGIREGLEMAAKVAEAMGADRIERNADGSLRSYDMDCKHGRGDAVLNAMRVRAQTIAQAIRAKAGEQEPG